MSSTEQASDLVATAIDAVTENFESYEEFDEFFEQLMRTVAINFRADAKRLGHAEARKRYDAACARAWKHAEAVAAECDAALSARGGAA